jgi:hypothetical protein
LFIGVDLAQRVLLLCVACTEMVTGMCVRNRSYEEIHHLTDMSSLIPLTLQGEWRNGEESVLTVDRRHGSLQIEYSSLIIYRL